MTPRVTLESLAVMVKEGFENSAKEMADFRAEVKAEFDRVDLRLSQAAYRFEVVDLENRVDYVERRLGISKL